MLRKNGELIIYGVCVILCVFFLFVIKDLPATARNFPQFSLISLIVVAGLGFIKTLLSLQKSDKEKAAADCGGERKFLFTLLLSVLFVFSMKYLGFYTASLLYLTSLMYLLNIRKIKVVLMANIVFLTGIYLVFSLFLNVPVEKGIFF